MRTGEEKISHETERLKWAFVEDYVKFKEIFFSNGPQEILVTIGDSCDSSFKWQKISSFQI